MLILPHTPEVDQPPKSQAADVQVVWYHGSEIATAKEVRRMQIQITYCTE